MYRSIKKIKLKHKVTIKSLFFLVHQNSPLYTHIAPCVHPGNGGEHARDRGNEWRKQREYDCLPDLNQFPFADHMIPMVYLSLNTGLRRGELLSLRWSSVNFDLAIVTITGDTAKSGKTRHVPLNAIALQVLKDWKKTNQQNEFIFINDKTGDTFGNVKTAWKNILKAAKIDNFRWHDMRHHFASKLVMAGVDLNTVRELLGHADIKMTLRYAHLAPEHKASAVAKLVAQEV